MQITEVRIKLMDDPGERLQAFCSITFDDCFVVRDLKIIDGSNGPFVAMPSRKLTSHCPRCGCKNHLRASYCNQCGTRLNDEQASRDDDGRAKLYADIAHPINSACREMIQERVIEAYEEELRNSQQPGYVSRYDEFDEEAAVASGSPAESPAEEAAAPSESASSEEQTAAETQQQEPAEEKAETREPAGRSRSDEQQAKPREQPRGPHKTPSNKQAGAAPWRPSPPKGFGEGIF